MGNTTAPQASEVIPPILAGVAVLLVVLLAAALLVMYLGRWVKGRNAGPLPSADLLSQFRLLYERGECSREEFDHIRAKLGKRLREELEVATAPAPVQESSPPDPARDQIRLPADPVEPRIGPAADAGPDPSNPNR
jgi:hypothetical protein